MRKPPFASNGSMSLADRFRNRNPKIFGKNTIVMKLLRWHRASRLHVMRAYLIFILSCTFLLFCFNVISFYRERENVTRLSQTNYELAAKTAAADTERDIDSHAKECLSNRNIFFDAKRSDSLSYLKQFRGDVELLKKKFPVAHEFFVFDRDRVLFPRVEEPPAQDLAFFLASEPNQNRIEFKAFLSEAERHQNLDRQAEAAGFFSRAEDLNVSERLKALAVYRYAQGLLRGNHIEEAAKAYAHLLDRYGDEYDSTQTPYALLPLRSHFPSQVLFFGPQRLRSIYDHLTDGRWEMSTEQLEQYRADLEARLGIYVAGLTSSYLEHHRLGKVLLAAISTRHLRLEDDFGSMSLMDRDTEHQIFFCRDRTHPNVFVGFSLWMPWVAGRMREALANQFPGKKSLEVSIINDLQAGSEDEHEIHVSFPTILPFGKVRVAMQSDEAPSTRLPREELWFIAISSFTFISILAVVVYLLIRVSWDIRWFQVRSDFVSGVSHDFKTPLSLVRLYSETLADHDEDFSPEERKNYTRIIARESARMSRLVDNVLNFSKIEEGKSESSGLKLDDIGNALEGVIEEYCEYLTWKGFELKSSISHGLPPVRFSPERLSQMVLNLIENAVKYSTSSRFIGVNAWCQDREVFIEVEDHGPGIPVEEQRNIFLPFYRTSNGNEKGGCGLGLYLVNQVMKEHGGRVEVESMINKGSRFRLVFPVEGSKEPKISLLAALGRGWFNNAKENTHR